MMKLSFNLIRRFFRRWESFKSSDRPISILRLLILQSQPLIILLFRYSFHPSATNETKVFFNKPKQTEKNVLKSLRGLLVGKRM